MHYFKFGLKAKIIMILVSVGFIFLFGGAGYLLGSYYGNKEALLVIGIIVSFPLSQYTISRILRGMARHELGSLMDDKDLLDL